MGPADHLCRIVKYFLRWGFQLTQIVCHDSIIGSGNKKPATTTTGKGHVMPLDIIPIEEQAATRCKAKGGDIWATHKRIDDVSLYEKYGQVRRVPLEADLNARSDGAR